MRTFSFLEWCGCGGSEREFFLAEWAKCPDGSGLRWIQSIGAIDESEAEFFDEDVDLRRVEVAEAVCNGSAQLGDDADLAAEGGDPAGPRDVEGHEMLLFLGNWVASGSPYRGLIRPPNAFLMGSDPGRTRPDSSAESATSGGKASPFPPQV